MERLEKDNKISSNKKNFKMLASEKEIDAFLNQYLKVDDQKKKEDKEQIKELMKKDNRILSNAIKIYKEPRTSGTNIEQQNKINETVTTTLLRSQKILQELQTYLKNQNKVFEEQQKYDIEMLKKASTKNDNKEIEKIQEKMIKNLNKNTLQNLIIMTISSIMYPDNLSRYCDYYYDEGAEAYRLLVMQEIMNNFEEYKNLIKNIDKNCKISLKISNIGMYLDDFINNIWSSQQIGKNLFNLEKGDFIEAILNAFVWKIIEQDKKGYYMNNEFNDYKNFINKYYNVQTKYEHNVLQCINNATGFVAKTINKLDDNNLKEILKKHKNYKNDILQYKQDYALKNNREATTLEFLHLLYNNYVDKQNDYFTTTIAKSFFTVMQNKDNQDINTLATDLDTYEIIKMLNSTEKPLVRYEIDEKDKDVLVPIGNYTNKKYEHHKIKVKDIQNSKSDKQVLDAVVNIIGKEFVNTVFKKHLNNNKSILLKLKQQIFDNVIKEKNNYKHLIEEARTYLQNNQSKVFMSGIIESNNDKKKTAIKSKSKVKKNKFFRLEKNTTIEDIFNKINNKSNQKPSNNKSNQKPSNNNNINLIDDDSIQEGINGNIKEEKSICLIDDDSIQEGINSNIINNNINININKYKKKDKNKVKSSSQINMDKKYNQKDNFLISGIINNNSNINNIQKQNTNVLKKENIIPEKRAEDNSKNSKNISKNNINNGNVYENNLMNSTSKKNNAQQYQ